MGSQASLIAELEGAINGGSQDRRIETLRRVTDLFLSSADRFNEAQIGLFDDVLGHLVERIETRAKAELSARLAPVDNAPAEVIRTLARDDEITVAGPVLTQSARLTTDDLVDIARTKSQQHLMAISGRDEVAEAVTDVLVDRGDRAVVHTIARNTGAKFSETGLSSLVKRADGDDTLAETVGIRVDVPPVLLRRLLTKASETVQARLAEHARPGAADEINRVLSDVISDVGREASAPRNYAAAAKLVERMQTQDELNEAALLEFIDARKFEETVAGLAAICSAPLALIDSLMSSDRNDALLVPCKAAGLKWPTVNALLKNRFADRTVSDQAIARARTDYLTLSQTSALRILRFWQVRNGGVKGAH